MSRYDSLAIKTLLRQTFGFGVILGTLLGICIELAIRGVFK